MTKPEKLLAQLLANSNRAVSFRDFEALLLDLGFVWKRTKGSHRQYSHPALPRPFPVQSDGKDAKPYQVRVLLELVRRYGLHSPS